MWIRPRSYIQVWKLCQNSHGGESEKMPRICVVPGRKTGSRIELSKHSLFRVPKDTVRWKQWENAIPGISKLSSLDVICDKHFKAEDISHEWKKEDENGQIIARVQYKRPRLSDTAVPTKFNESTGKMGIESADLENLSPNIVNDIVNLLPATTSDMEEANIELPSTAEPSSDYDEPLPICEPAGTVSSLISSKAANMELPATAGPSSDYDEPLSICEPTGTVSSLVSSKVEDKYFI